MKKETNKDWIEAIREKTLLDGTAPSPTGWEAIGRRVRRGAALRRSALIAAVILPLAALLLWSPFNRHPGLDPESPSAAITLDSSPVSPNATPAISDLIGDLPTGESLALEQKVTPSSTPAQNEDKQPGIEAPSSKQGSNEIQIPDSPNSTQQASSTNQTQNVYEGATAEALSTKQAPIVDEVSVSRHHTRVSIGLRGGTNAIRREAGIAMRSAPYIATLTYMNTLNPGMLPQVKSTTSNTLPYEIGANMFFSESASATYHHHLPLSVGLQLKLDLLPWLGVESGAEYTYLHSTQESAAGTLDQRLHFVGIPLRVDFRIWQLGSFDLYAGFGAKLEKCVSASLGRVACEEPRLQFSAEAFGGIQFQLWGRAHLYLQPSLSWYLTHTDLITYRTENPVGFSVNAGLRFDL